ncbi:hypothetical protein [Actinoplanes teichomyceticus]|uniref:Uncharacterized protein n=1 Tax=Actinoplanes teichomyceticus TaxID=1867 RepID=A0A561VST4_ACTTI|nr:hypothetical protein [Actinoplanes teichomyceticus]TWG14667.1 hypothetical protein FHX34_104973 [Actinoplanes teichomyceticus]GIF10070.1 hypothetical protein Ate01nite_01020 [Actinoplanes teichomyceticus]
MNFALNDRPDRSEKRAGSGMPRIASRLGVAAVAFTAVLSGGVPAFAEGSWSSYLSGVRSGFISREWTDNNSDSVVTKTTLRGCSRDDGANFSLKVDLRRKRSLSPDVSYGQKDVSACAGGTGTGTWGDQTSGTYFLQFWHYDFGTVSASSVATVY